MNEDRSTEAIAEVQTTVSGPVQKLRYLDSIRGIATICVILAHVQTMFVLPFGGLVAARDVPLSVAWIIYTDFIGGLFLTITGYCAMLPIMLSPDHKIRGGVRAYLFRRGQRILLPYYLVILVSCVLIKLLEKQPIGITYGVDGQVTPFTVITHLLLVHNLTGSYRYMINGPMWYVGLQWQLYILFPLFFLPIWKRFGTKVLLAITCTIGYGTMLFYSDPEHIFPWYIGLFAMGMTLAEFSHSNNLRYKVWRERIPWGRIAWGIFVIGTLARIVDIWVSPAQIYDLIPDYRRLICYDFLSVGFIGASILHCQRVEHYQRREVEGKHERVTILYRVLSHPWLVWVGTISYSLILTHYPVLIAVRQTAMVLHLSSVQVVFWIYLVGLVMVGIVGQLFFTGIQNGLVNKVFGKK